MRLDYAEGATPIDPEEIVQLIPGISLQSELNEFEAWNILQAIAWAARSRLVRNNLLSLAALVELHRRMFDRTWRWAGLLRTTQKNMGVPSYEIGPAVKSLCDDVKTWLEHRTYPPDEIATRFHHRLVWIHPFPNGNGRHARLATDLLCRSQGWARFTWGSANLIEESETRRRYILALRAADAHDYAPLLNFVRS